MPDVVDQSGTDPAEGAAPSDHRALSLGLVLGTYVGFSSWAYFAWYYGHAHNPKFIWGGDGWVGPETYAGGADKFGHAWAGLTSTRLGTWALEQGGWSKEPAIGISTFLSMLCFFLVEVKDGYFYQFSFSDLTGDFTGSLLGAAMEQWPELDRLLDFRVEYFPSKPYREILGGAKDADINALNIAEDYSGETYLLAFHLGHIDHLDERPNLGWTRYLDATIGFESRNYKPDLVDMPNCDAKNPYCEQQTLYVGLAFDAQELVDHYLHGKTRKVLHALSEVFQLPFTETPVVGVGRHPTKPPDPSTSGRMSPP